MRPMPSARIALLSYANLAAFATFNGLVVVGQDESAAEAAVAISYRPSAVSQTASQCGLRRLGLPKSDDGIELIVDG